MWSISQLKEYGRNAFKMNYWRAVLAALILGIVIGSYSNTADRINSSSSSSSGQSSYQEDYETFDENAGDNEVPSDWESVDPDEEGTDHADADDAATDEAWEEIPSESKSPVTLSIGNFNWQGNIPADFMGMWSVLMTVLMIVIILLKISIGYCLEVGGRRFFVQNLQQKAGLGELLYAFKGGWVHTVLTLLLRDVKVFLWTLLLVIPGIVKHYEYLMVPYLLAEDPNMDTGWAFEQSKNMMMGHKSDAFMLDLSYIGWDILSGITMGLTGIFYSNPYKYSTFASFYYCLKQGWNINTYN